MLVKSLLYLGLHGLSKDIIESLQHFFPEFIKGLSHASCHKGSALRFAFLTKVAISSAFGALIGVDLDPGCPALEVLRVEKVVYSCGVWYDRYYTCNLKGCCLKSQIIFMNKNFVSPFHLIFWAFVLPEETQRLMEDAQKGSIQKIYRTGADVVNPMPQNPHELKELLELIQRSNKQCAVKVVVEASQAQEVLNMVREHQNIVEVYLYNRNMGNNAIAYGKVQSNAQFNYERLFSQNSKLISQSSNIDEYIKQAERQVQKWTKPFRTFQNSLLLAGDFVDSANRYRFRLIACMGTNPSDYQSGLEKFKTFATKQAPLIQNHHSNMLGHSTDNKKDILRGIKNYCDQAKKMVQKELKSIKEKNKLSLEQKDTFYTKILDLYQGKQFFYHIINSNLRTVREINATNWEQIALPFFHLYQAIKFEYDRSLEEEKIRQDKGQNVFYRKPFKVYRAGRIRKSQKQTYQRYANKKVYIEFFGFLSTSLNIQTVIDIVKTSTSKASNDSQDEEEDTNEMCIFQIDCQFEPKICEQRYKNINHGFYKFSDNNKHGDQQFEVLFNALNVFQLVKISRKEIFDLIPNESKARFGHRYMRQREFYSQEICHISLKYGQFHRTLIEQNPYNLSQEQQKARLNYIYCLNRINKYNKFDIADAYELTNQIQKAYKYREKKISEEITTINLGKGKIVQKIKSNQFERCKKEEKDIKEQQKSICNLLEEEQIKIKTYQECQKKQEEIHVQLFANCRLDSKNHYQQFSLLCGKLGKVNQGLIAAKHAVECQEQLECIYLNNLYNEHYEKLFKMQQRIVDILNQKHDYYSTDIELNQQLYKLKSKHFEEPRAKLRQAEIEINQAVNYYSVGKVQKSKQKFLSCSRCVGEAIDKLNPANFQVKDISCSDFISNLFIPDIKYGRICSYSQYAEKVRRQHEKQERQRLIQLYGGQQQLAEVEQITEELSAQVFATICKIKPYMKDQTQYEALVNDHQLRSKRPRLYNGCQKTPQQTLCQEIKSIMKAMTTLQPNSEQYTQKNDIFQTKCKELEEISGSKLSADCKVTLDSQTLKKFKEKQRQRRIQMLKERKSEYSRDGKDKLKAYLKQEAQKLKRNIDKLKNEGYTDQSIPILKRLNERAKLLEACGQGNKAHQQIEKLLRGLSDKDHKNYEVATAYMTRGKIQLKVKQADKAIKSFQRAIYYFEKNAQDTLFKQSNPNLSKQQIIKQNNHIVELKIMKIRAYLIIYNKIVTTERQVMGREWLKYFFIQNYRQKSLNSSQSIFIQADLLLKEVNEILMNKQKTFKLWELEADCEEVRALFYLETSSHIPKLVGQAMILLKQACQKRKIQMGEISPENALKWCQIVQDYNQNQLIMSFILKSNALQIIEEAEKYSRNCIFFERIKQAKEFLAKYGQKLSNQADRPQQAQIQNIGKTALPTRLPSLKITQGSYMSKQHSGISTTLNSKSISPIKQKQEKQDNIDVHKQQLDPLTELN